MKRRTLGLFVAAATLAWGQNPAAENEPPSKDVELTVYMLSGVMQPGTADDVPLDLAPTVKQLHSLFSYKAYKLAESFILRGRSALNARVIGQGHSTSGVLPGSGVRYDFSYQRVRVSEQKPYMVHIDGLRLSLFTQGTYGPDGKPRGNNTVGSINTDLDLTEGQRTVVGKSSINSAGDALILVIVPKVIE